MQVGVGTVGGRIVVAAALAAVLGGCAESVDGDGEKSASASASTKGATAGGTGAKGTAAARGGTIGAAGSACELPVSFDIAQHWKAKSIDADKELAKSSQGEDG
ncbi:lipoprotein, partial [Streptomyces olivaceoviridis]